MNSLLRLQEGTWCCPYSMNKALAILALLKHPVSADDASHIMYNLYGNDTLFDTFLDSETPEDVRPEIIEGIKRLVNDIENEYSVFRDHDSEGHVWNVTWDPEVVGVLKEIANYDLKKSSKKAIRESNESRDDLISRLVNEYFTTGYSLDQIWDCVYDEYHDEELADDVTGSVEAYLEDCGFSTYGENFTIKESYKSEKYKDLIGKTICIEDMDGEPHYTGKTGVVKFVDDEGQLHGTWGGLAVVPGVDSYTVLEDKMTVGSDEDKVGLSVEWVKDALGNMLKEEDIKRSSSTPVKSSNLKVYVDKENGDVSVEGQVVFTDPDIEPDTCYCNFNVNTEEWEWGINNYWGDDGTGWGKFIESMLDEGFIPQTAPYRDYIKFDLSYKGKYKEANLSRKREKYLEDDLTVSHTKYVLENVLNWDRGWDFDKRSLKQIAKACAKYDDNYSAEEYYRVIKDNDLLQKNTKNSIYRKVDEKRFHIINDEENLVGVEDRPQENTSKLTESQMIAKNFIVGPGTVNLRKYWYLTGDEESESSVDFNESIASSIEDLARSENFNDDLAQYCDIDGVQSITFSEVRSVEGKYYMVWRVVYDADKITDFEELKDYLEGQMSDGWGEGFEQDAFGEDRYSEEIEFEDYDEEEGRPYTYMDRSDVAESYYYSPWNGKNFNVIVEDAE